MLMSSYRVACLSLLGVGICAASLLGQFESLTKWLPDSTNSIVLVQPKRIFDSELSKTRGWRKDQLQAFKSGAAFFHPETQYLIIGAELDMETMSPHWKVSLITRRGTPINIGTISEKIGGLIDSVSGRDAVALPNDTFVIKIDDQTVAAMTPANRQATSRWLDSRGKAPSQLTPYIQKAIGFADKNADVIMAMDLANVISETEITKRLQMGGVISGAAVPAMAKVLATIQGLTLGITVRDKIFGSIKIDFTENTGPLSAQGKQLLIDVLQRRGTMIDDLQNWDFEANGTQVRLSGPLTDSGFRDILSLVRHSIEHDLVYSTGQETADPGNAQQQMATSSKQYFNKVEAIFQDMRSKSDKSLVTYAKWFERYAEEIDHMSMLNVDPDVAKFGMYVSQSFRDTAGTLRGASLDKKAALAGTADEFSGGRFGAYDSYWGGYGGSYYYMNDRSRERRSIGTQYDVEGEKKARDLLGEVVQTMSELRRSMSEKYQINF